LFQIQCTSAKSNLIKPLIVKKRTDLGIILFVKLLLNFSFICFYFYIDISSIKIPTTKHRGKPKGALQTVIGLKKKRKILTKKPFKFLHYNERNKLILSWFCSIDVVNKALSSNFKINDTNLNEYNSIPNNIIDELVDLFQVGIL